jgi:hypothetical protein
MSEILSDDDHRALVREAGLTCTAGWPIYELIRYGRAVERAVLSRLVEMGGDLPTFDAMMREADAYVRGKAVWARYIDGTPLSNDIAVWITVCAQQYVRDALARGVAAGMAQERARCVAVCEAVDLADDEKEQTR